MAHDLATLRATLRHSRALAGKKDIAQAAAILQPTSPDAIRLGDDCAAIPDGDGYLLLASEGFQDSVVRSMPWFAWYCGVLVIVSDIAAMGGRPMGAAAAFWSDINDAAAKIRPGRLYGALI